MEDDVEEYGGTPVEEAASQSRAPCLEPAADAGCPRVQQSSEPCLAPAASTVGLPRPVPNTRYIAECDPRKTNSEDLELT